MRRQFIYKEAMNLQGYSHLNSRSEIMGAFKTTTRRRLAGLFFACAFAIAMSAVSAAQWVAIHVLNHGSDAGLAVLRQQLPRLAELGVNTMVLEVDYSFEFQSHPELRGGGSPITRDGARKFAADCKERGIRLIPQFQCLGHQSWAKNTFPLLTKYPELDLTPGAFPNNEGLYCREWDPLNPKVNEIVFPLMGEILDAFNADAMHVGMDEIFLIGDEKSPSTKGKNPAEVFAKAVNDIHEFLVKKRKVEMLMWADRFIDASKMKYGKWEASANGISPAIDMVPKDIIMCDWHYEKREDYPSVPMFIEKGFRVVPTSWRNVEACKKLIQYSLDQKSGLMLGHMFSNWSGKKGDYAEFPPLVEGSKLLRRP